MFSREDLQGMNLRQLRLIDIKEVEDEKLVQQLINEKSANSPITQEVNRSDIPDIKTPEEEAKYQKIVDERTARIKERNMGTLEAPGQPLVEETRKDVVNTIDHTITQEDLDNNPELVGEGVKVGEIVEIPKPTNETPVEILQEGDLKKLKKDELVEYAQKIGLEFGEEVTNNPQRVDAIVAFLGTLKDNTGVLDSE